MTFKNKLTCCSSETTYLAESSTTSVNPLSICFVAHNAYGAISRTDIGHAGGIERQQSLMARALAARAHRVSMITWDHGQPDGEIHDGVRIWKMCRRGSGLKFIRFIHPTWTSLCDAMRRANAELYYYNCGDLCLGQIAMWCRRHRRRCIYTVASDPDCDPRLPSLNVRRERWLYRYGLRHTDAIITQSQRQREMLLQGFQLDSTPIPMPCETLIDREDNRADYDGQAPRILWVGRLSREKRLEWLLDIAALYPAWQFDVVGAANTPSNYASELLRRTATLPNVNMHGRVQHDQINAYYRRATILCCTSVFEGFPNTYLEAWRMGVPVVTTCDPDDLIATHRLGAAASDVTGLAEALERLVTNPARWQEVSTNSLEYFMNNHTIDRVLQRFEQVFREICRPVDLDRKTNEPRRPYHS